MKPIDQIFKLDTPISKEASDVWRICCCLTGFKARYGHWPSKLKVDPKVPSYLEELLTREALQALKDRITIEAANELMDFIAMDDSGNEWSYAKHEIPRTTNDSIHWLWGGGA